ncbi:MULTISPECIES: hypothetical protein [unclassified Lysinibacillus]|nr:hypothetical protein [Lysinibacillus sp. BPa_S21]
MNNCTPYQSLMDEIAHFPEIPTAIGVWLVTGILELAASQKLSN